MQKIINVENFKSFFREQKLFGEICEDFFQLEVKYPCFIYLYEIIPTLSVINIH